MRQKDNFHPTQPCPCCSAVFTRPSSGVVLWRLELMEDANEEVHRRKCANFNRIFKQLVFLESNIFMPKLNYFNQAKCARDIRK